MRDFRVTCQTRLSISIIKTLLEAIFDGYISSKDLNIEAVLVAHGDALYIGFK